VTGRRDRAAGLRANPPDAPLANAPFANAPFADAPFADAPFADAPFADAELTEAELTDPESDDPDFDEPDFDDPESDDPESDDPEFNDAESDDRDFDDSDFDDPDFDDPDFDDPEFDHALGQDIGRALLTLRGLRGALVETVWGSAHLAIYPLGLIRERHEPHDRYHLGGLAPVQRGLVVGNVEAAGTPILLVHGMVDNRAIFTVLSRWLRRRGFGRVFTLNYPPTTNDIRSAARNLSGAVEDLIAQTGYERIHVVGHSLGGLIARYYVQRLGGDERVHTLVTLGSPHGGTLTASVLPLRLFRQLRPGSDLFQELAQPVTNCRTRFVAYWSPMDQLILPHENARVEHPDLRAHNVLVPDVGHMSIPIDGTVVHEISLLLSELDSDGTVLSAGVTALLDDRATDGQRRARPAQLTPPAQPAAPATTDAQQAHEAAPPAAGSPDIGARPGRLSWSR
jgi:triacylglycerol lipase